MTCKTDRTEIVARRSLVWTMGIVALLTIGFSPWVMGAPRALPGDKVPADQRLQPLKDLDGYFPLSVPATKEEWEQRAAKVRRQILTALGLSPMPTRMPLNPVIHGKVDREDYTVEKAYFESMPGFYVTGSLYRPKGKSGKLPAVLCPHGHWANGRFHDAGVDAVKKEIERGAEKFEEGGRSPLQARCVHLARMGCVVFHYDMIGYADCQQISFDVAHRFAKQRADMSTAENWGLFSPQAESHVQSVMGLQTYNSIRALDFVSSLPDVDPTRIGVTGASGGGTQTFILCAIDPRPVVAFPAVMVSTAMQGGCTCENASLLRVNTGNVEFAGLFAPKPLAMSAADDWTKEMTTKGFPELKQLYKTLGAADNVFLISRTEFGHNYNLVSRLAMYGWFNQHLRLGIEGPIQERDYKRLSQAEMSVWDASHPKPESGDAFERKLLKWWHDDAEQQLRQAEPKDAAGLAKFREVVGGGWNAIVERGLPAAKELEYDQTDKQDFGTYLRMVGLLRNASRGEEIPVAFLYPKEWKGRVVLWLSPEGKSGMFGEGDKPRPEIQRLIDAGISVASADLLYQGESSPDGKPLERTGRVKNTREAAAYTFGYNHTVFAKRVHDVLSLVAYVQNHDKEPKEIDVVALGETGPIAAVARTQAGNTIHCAALETNGFRFGKVPDLHHPGLLPGGAKYGDLPAALALAAPGRTWLAGESGQVPEIAKMAYSAAGGGANIVSSTETADLAKAAIEWLLTQTK